MDRRRIARLFLIPALAGTAAGALAYVYLKPPGTRPVATVPVVVARKAVPAQTRLTPDMLAVRQVARDVAPPGAIASVGEAAGKVTVLPLAEGEPVLRLAFEAARGAAGSLAAQIPAGRRAVTLAVSEVSGLAGRLETGDRVDLIAVFSKEVTGVDQATLLLEDLPVLALGKGQAGGSQQGRGAAAAAYNSVTLAVTPQQAVTIALAARRGQLQLALRPAGSEGGVGRLTVTDAAFR